MTIEKILSIAIYIILVTASSVYADEITAQDYADKFYADWNHPKILGDDSGASRVGSFNKQVPDSLKGQVLDQLLNRACTAKPEKAWEVIENVESVLSVLGPAIKIPPHLDKNLYSLTKNANYMVRIYALNTLQQLKRSQDHDVIVAALNDSNDEVRAAAFAALYGRSDVDAATYQKYLQDHQSDPAYAKSVKYAKGGLNAKTNAQKGDKK